MNQDSDIAGEAFRIGASAYLLKNSGASELQKAIQEVLRGGTYVTPQTREGIQKTFIRDPQATADAILKCWERIRQGRKPEVTDLHQKLSFETFAETFIRQLSMLGL